MSQGANSDVHRAMGDFKVELLRQVKEGEMAEGCGATGQSWAKGEGGGKRNEIEAQVLLADMPHKVKQECSKEEWNGGRAGLFILQVNGLNGCRCAGVKI